MYGLYNDRRVDIVFLNHRAVLSKNFIYILGDIYGERERERYL